jgi:hypothetical protein
VVLAATTSSLAENPSKLPCWRHDGKGCDNKSKSQGLKDSWNETEPGLRDASECAVTSVGKSLVSRLKKDRIPTVKSLATGSLKPGFECGQKKGYAPSYADVAGKIADKVLDR